MEKEDKLDDILLKKKHQILATCPLYLTYDVPDLANYGAVDVGAGEND